MSYELDCYELLELCFEFGFEFAMNNEQ